MQQFSQSDDLRQPFCHLGAPKIIFISRGTSAFENVVHARKRRGSLWHKEITPVLPISGDFLQYFEGDFELCLQIFVYVLHDFCWNP
jgi:hypothetical protein